jgi:quercetin dioxygenase-like cupin family protein
MLLTMLILWIQPTRQVESQETTFTGQSARVEAEGITVTSRMFEAGARTHWHTHSEQLLFVREGRQRYQVQGGRVADIGLHETAHLPRGVPHWHGATPGEALTHVSVTFPDADGERLAIAWGNPVTDEQYER